MTPGAWRHVLLALSVVACAAIAFAGPPLPQPLDYHRFADTRTFFGVANALNVLSNLFAIAGLAGVLILGRARIGGIARWAYLALFAGVTLTTFGSSYYHLAPDTDRLVWDRLPMAIGFMGLLTAIAAERVSARAAAWLFVPLLALGCVSVLYWRWTELRGAGDLRLYLLVQFGSLVVVLLMLFLYPARDAGTRYLMAGLAAYAAAKGFELADRPIFDAGRLISGHTLKHVVAAASVACIAVMLAVRARDES